MSGTGPDRSISRRLVAVCTAGILSLGAFALGTGAQAAEPGAHSGVQQPTRTTVRLPHLTQPKTAAQRSQRAMSSAARVATPAPQRYDIDGDGVGDQLLRIGNDSIVASLADRYEELGTSSEMFVDIVTPGDLDGTAGPEVLATTTSGRLEMFTPGNFPASPSWSGGGWNAYNKIVAVDDLSGDGRADIVARDHSGNLYLYPGTGNGAAPFAARIAVGSGWGQYDQLTSPGDVDGDGISDLVARDTAGALWLYRGTGTATAPFAGRTGIGTGWNTYNQIIGLGNDGSGTASLWGRTVDGTLYYYKADGTGGLTARTKTGTGWNVDLIADSGSVPYWGKKELIGETPNGTLYWYGTTDDGRFTPRTAVSYDGDWAGHFSLVNANALTSSGYTDLLDLWNGGLHVMDENYTLISSGWSSYNLVIGPGDLSGEGNGDLLGRDTSGRLYLFRGNGDGRHLASRQLVGGGWGGYNAIVGAGDLSGDGRADIVARDGSGTLYLYKGTGNAAAPFSARVRIGSGWGQYTKLASPGDMDGDGRADLLAVDSAGTAYRYSAAGTGQFKARAALGAGWNTYKKLY